MFQELEKRGSKVLRSTSLSIKQVHTLSYIQNPLLLLLSSYVAGIILANIFGFLDYFSLFIIFIIVCFLSWLSYKNDWKITIILFLLSFLFIGMVNTSYHLQPVGPNNIYNFSGEQGNLFGTVCHAEIKQAYNYQEIQVKTNFFQLYDKRYQANGHVLLRVYGVEPVIKFGDVIKAEVLLQEPELPGNFGEFNYRDYLKRQNIFLTDSIEINKLEITGHSENLSINSLIYGIKNRITRKIEKIYKSPGKSLIKAILIGDKTEISRELTDIFQDAGIMHILAISGLHVGIIAIVLLFIFNLIPKYWINDLFKYLIIIIIMLGYAAMTGFRPSVSRATLMLAIVIIAKCFNRPYHIYNSLYLAAFLILLWQPLYVYDAGFLLSFVVTFFIIFLAPILEDKLEYLPSYFRKLFSVSLSAWLGVVPLSAYFFYKISFIGILSNIIIIPLIGVILILALLSIFLSFLFLPIAQLFSLFNEVLINLLLIAGKKLSSLPFAYQHVAQPGLASIILYYIIILTVFYSIHFWAKYDLLKKKRRFWLIVSFSFILIFINVLFPSSLLAVHFINVGQGDCILVQTPQKKNILIDGGGTPYSDYDIGKNIVIPYLRREGISQIDIMFLTHPDTDHLEGLLPVLKEMKVNLVVDSGVQYQDKMYLDFLSLIQEDENISYFQTRAGDVIRIGSDIEISIINPSIVSNCVLENDFNNNSIVLKLQYKNTDFLFTGDIEEPAEINILSRNNLLKSDILKVAHHGSDSSTGDLFLEKIKPEVAIISVGANNFGHPNPDVIKKLEKKCQKVFRTDLNGTIIVRSNGSKYYINILR